MPGPSTTILTEQMRKNAKMFQPKNIFMLEILREIALKKLQMHREVGLGQVGQGQMRQGNLLGADYGTTNQNLQR